MRGAAMSFRAGLSGLVLLLLAAAGVMEENNRGVNYPTPQICAVTGSTVDIPCTFTYPTTINQEHGFWFTKNNIYGPLDLKSDQDFSDRVEYLFSAYSGTLRITDLRQSDSAEYKFRLTTNQPDRPITISPGVSLSVTDLQVEAKRSGSNVELKCWSSCNTADLSYFWTRNKQKLNDQGSSLTVSFNDNNKYSCGIRGYDNYPSPEVYAPTGCSVSKSSTGEIRENSEVTLTCSCDGHPAPEYTWYKENHPERLSTGSRHVFRSVQSSDSGRYYCGAKNDVGERTSAYIDIDVKYAPKPPTVSVSPSAEVLEGTRVTLTCSSDADPAPSYTWYKRTGDQRSPPLSTEKQLYFGSIQASDSGEYYCTAVNTLGGKRSEITKVDVQYAPTGCSVSKSPRGEIREDSEVTLTCSCDGHPAPEYTWYKENHPEHLSTGSRHVFGSVQSSDSGRYYCGAKNDVGERTSAYIDINVKYAPKPPTVSVSPSAEVLEGTRVTLTCSSDANPAPTYTWYKRTGDQRSPPLSTEKQLYFWSIQASDSGEYYCTAVNTLGGKQSEITTVDVQYAPRQTSASASPSGDHVEGSSVTLTCQSDANPAPAFTWYKKSEKQMSKYSEGHQLHLSSIKSSDSAEYSCEAMNTHGKVSSAWIHIDVKYGPKPPNVSVSPSAEVKEGTPVNLSCTIDANPPANYTWYKMNEDKPKSFDQIFTIMDTRPEHSGTYVCLTQNKRGRQKSTILLTVVAEPQKSSVIFATVPAVFIAVILVFVFIWIIKKRTSKQSSEPGDRPDNSEQIQQTEQQDDLQYATVHFSKTQPDAVYSNITPNKTKRHKRKKEEDEDMVEYSTVKFNKATTIHSSRGEESAEDPALLYSTVNLANKKR